MSIFNTSTLDVSSITSILQVSSAAISPVSLINSTKVSAVTIEAKLLADAQSALEAERQKNSALNTQVASLKAKIATLAAQLSEQDQNTEFSTIIGQGSQAILDASTAEDIATRTKDAATTWADNAQASADLAMSTDPTSAAAVDAQIQARTAQTKKATVLQAGLNVSNVIDQINQLARIFITTPADVTSEQDSELKTLITTLQDYISAASVALNELKGAAASAAQLAAASAVDYDNWDMLGVLFGFATPSNETIPAEVTVATTNTNRSSENPVLEEIDNWEVIQQKFSIPELTSNGGVSV